MQGELETPVSICGVVHVAISGQTRSCQREADHDGWHAWRSHDASETFEWSRTGDGARLALGPPQR